jgi:hypothetical protein
MDAKMCRFYGFTYDYVQSIPIDDYFDLWQAITQLEAQENLMQMTIMDYPKMRKDDRKKLHRKFRRMAYPSTGKNAISASEMKKILESRG